MTPGSVAVDIVFVRCPLGDPAVNEKMWEEIDEQHFPAELRQRLARNGFRAGVIGAQFPRPGEAPGVERKAAPRRPDSRSPPRRHGSEQASDIAADANARGASQRNHRLHRLRAVARAPLRRGRTPRADLRAGASDPGRQGFSAGRRAGSLGALARTAPRPAAAAFCGRFCDDASGDVAASTGVRGVDHVRVPLARRDGDPQQSAQSAGQPGTLLFHRGRGQPRPSRSSWCCG